MLHKVFNPLLNDRHTVAKRIIAGLSGKLLDIGCWGGKSLQLMGAFEQFEELYGVDIIKESVESARQIGIKATQCNLNEEPLPFDDNYFNVVTCLAVIGQIFDPYFVVKEIHRVLKINGILILNVPNVASLPNRIRLLLGRLPVTSRGPGWDGGQLHYFTQYDTINF